MYDGSLHRMAFGTGVLKIGKLLVLLGALALTFVASFVLSMRLALRASEVPVPSLSGVTVTDATTALTEIGLTLQVDEAGRPDARVPAGRITQQEPLAGTRARRQRSVRVWVSTGPRTVVMPRIVGQSERTARIRLEQGDMTIASTSEIHSTDYPPDTVIAQTPEPDAAAAGVRLLINRGEPAIAYLMPDVMGAEGERVADALRQQGLRVAIATVPGADSASGVVIRQTPAAGARVAATDIVSLEVSR